MRSEEEIKKLPKKIEVQGIVFHKKEKGEIIYEPNRFQLRKLLQEDNQ